MTTNITIVYMGTQTIEVSSKSTKLQCFMITNHPESAVGKCPMGYDNLNNLEYLNSDITQILVSHPAVITDLPSSQPFRIKIDLSGFPSILLGIDTNISESPEETTPELISAYMSATNLKFPVVYSNITQEFSVMQIIEF